MFWDCNFDGQARHCQFVFLTLAKPMLSPSGGATPRVDPNVEVTILIADVVDTLGGHPEFKDLLRNVWNSHEFPKRN